MIVTHFFPLSEQRNIKKKIKMTHKLISQGKYNFGVFYVSFRFVCVLFIFKKMLYACKIILYMWFYTLFFSL